MKETVIEYRFGLRTALATTLFREGRLSLAHSARVAGMSDDEFTAHLSRVGIHIVALSTAETQKDIETLDAWLASPER